MIADEVARPTRIELSPQIYRRDTTQVASLDALSRPDTRLSFSMELVTLASSRIGSVARRAFGGPTLVPVAKPGRLGNLGSTVLRFLPVEGIGLDVIQAPNRSLKSCGMMTSPSENKIALVTKLKAHTASGSINIFHFM
jgi:hypothetical protein